MVVKGQGGLNLSPMLFSYVLFFKAPDPEPLLVALNSTVQYAGQSIALVLALTQVLMREHYLKKKGGVHGE